MVLSDAAYQMMRLSDLARPATNPRRYYRTKTLPCEMDRLSDVNYDMGGLSDVPSRWTSYRTQRHYRTVL